MSHLIWSFPPNQVYYLKFDEGVAAFLPNGGIRRYFFLFFSSHWGCVGKGRVTAKVAGARRS